MPARFSSFFRFFDTRSLRQLGAHGSRPLPLLALRTMLGCRRHPHRHLSIRRLGSRARAPQDFVLRETQAVLRVYKFLTPRSGVRRETVSDERTSLSGVQGELFFRECYYGEGSVEC